MERRTSVMKRKTVIKTSLYDANINLIKPTPVMGSTDLYAHETAAVNSTERIHIDGVWGQTADGDSGEMT